KYCNSPKYWYKGFLSLQSSIDAAIIEMVANHSVWEEMKSIAGVRMKSQSILFSISLEYSYFMVVIVMCFFPFMYFLSRNVTREKKKLKVLMRTMGLQDIAFWKLLFLQIHLVFMLCSLLRTSKLVSSVGFLIIFIFGFLSLAVLIEDVPEPLKWFLGLMCPFAFNTGIAKVRASRMVSWLCLWLVTEHLFAFLAGKYGIPDPPLFCLKASYWKSRRGSTTDVPRSTANPEELLGDDVEPVPPEFRGKEAIRLHNIKKAYKKKDKKTEALRGLSLNIYEGQITALLGHSGAGKTTLLNVLSGLSFPSEGSATIYNYRLSEMGDREEIRGMIGICPQFNTQFEVLTVKENLKTFAEIKGIKSKEVEREVQNILELLDISNIQDTQAEKLSGGQKRKLSIGIAMLGNPQVLLLDEPTAGLDPLSRHQVWSLLREQQAGRVILFSTQFMDEADILADRKAFISHGRLKCVGSSLFLKKKWGICYHLRYLLHESCGLENVTSLVKGHIPNATFSGHSQYELRYKLPLENVNKFPDLFSGLDSCSEQGIINYGVSMTTLEDVFLRLEGEATAIQEDEHIPGEEWAEAGPQCPDKARPGSLLLSDTRKASVQGLALWRQQVSAMAQVHFLKLKRKPGVLTLFSCSLKSYRFTVLCHLEAINCFPVLVNIISNALLRTLNSTQHIQIWSHPFFSLFSPRYWDYFMSIYFIYMLLLFPGFPPHFAMGYTQDCKTGARAQLRISGLFPSAYWCGQALVDIPLCWILLFSMFGLQFAMSNKISGSASTFFLLVRPILVPNSPKKLHILIAGEVLGLLGPNGAGKSTAIKMITGETTLTAGQVLMKRGDGGGSQLQEQAPAFLGYCPQEDPLWPDLTPQQHLRVYAAVKGLCKEDTAAAVDRIVNALQLQDYLNKKVRKLPAGITRKLCVALSVLGNPAVLLLDEPSTGMDPNGQRRVWKTIRDALKTKESGAVLTTHYMEEAEAVCDRVAILVAGQLRCIGSIQYLKNKFGKGYLLEIKVKDPESSDVLHAEILKIFPGAARQERFPSLLVYKVPMKDALPLSQSFSKLEEGKSKTR
uniref:Uncharacterized protein n=1 Tax=Corvus moneduloides TaxID=1196302 RepID=A0A8C3H3W1_CORMO